MKHVTTKETPLRGAFRFRNTLWWNVITFMIIFIIVFHFWFCPLIILWRGKDFTNVYRRISGVKCKTGTTLCFFAYVYRNLFSCCSFSQSDYKRTTLVPQWIWRVWYIQFLFQNFCFLVTFFLAGWFVRPLLDIIIWRFLDLRACRKFKVIHWKAWWEQIATV